MEAAADEIVASTASPTVRLAALEWKIDAVPAMRDSLFQPDPYVALVDAWVLLYQMGDYFESGPGKTRLGPSSALAAAACRTSEDHLAGVAASTTTSGDVSKVRDFVRKWAAGHPITGTIAARQPILSIDINNELPGSLTVGQAAAELATSLDDLNRRLEVYSGQVVRQARWEVERQTSGVLEELSAKEAIPLAARAVASAERAANEISRLMPVFEGAARTAERAAEIIATERGAAVAAISADLVRTIDFAHRERIAVLEYLTLERQTAIDDLRKTITAEREAVVSDTEQVAGRLVGRAMDRLERLVLKVIVVLLVAAFAALLMIRLLFRRPSRSASAAI
jgi:tetrahydromethanopterin S-methyltransferase subunit G